jgi:hypothetical protein
MSRAFGPGAGAFSHPLAQAHGCEGRFNHVGVRRCFQSSAGQTKKLTRRSQLVVSDSTVLGCFTLLLGCKLTLAASQSDRQRPHTSSRAARVWRGNVSAGATCRARWKACDTSNLGWFQARHLAGSSPEAERTVADREHRGYHTAPLELAQHCFPAFSSFPIASHDRQQFLAPLGRTRIITSVQSRSSSSPMLKWIPSTQTYT